MTKILFQFPYRELSIYL